MPPVDEAFERDASGAFAWERPRPSWFARVARMARRAQDHGLVPALVLLWATYAPDTWAAARRPGLVMPAERIDGYVRLVAEAVGELDVMIVVAGDTDCATDATVTARGSRRRSPGDVRRACWASVLSGAGAGVAYGAHGVWQWHRRGYAFTRTAASGEPFPWSTALGLPAAWDLGHLRALVEELDLAGLRPSQELLRDDVPFLRVAATPDRRLVAAYLPHAVELRLAHPFTGHDVLAWELEGRRRWRPRVHHERDGTVVGLPPFNGDALVVLRARDRESSA